MDATPLILCFYTVQGRRSSAGQPRRASGVYLSCNREVILRTTDPRRSLSGHARPHRSRAPTVKPEPAHAPQSRRRAAHAVWAAVGVIVCLLLVLTGRGGHPPAIILLPLVLVAWAVGHGLIWGALRLAAAGRRKGAGAADGQPWPLGLKVAVVCTAAAALLGVAQVVGTVLTRRWYPFNQAGEWTAMLLVWLVHAACFAALLLRRGWSRLLSAALAFGWAVLLGVQVAEHFRRGASDTTGLFIVVALMVSLLLFGSYLVSSSKARSFLGD
jgi:hypothetical protein